MSDILQEAEEMMTRPNGYAPSQITQLVGGLVAEIKRLRAMNPFQVDVPIAIRISGNLFAYGNAEESAELQRLLMQLVAKDALINDLMANCNQLRDRCWKAEQEVSQLQASKTGIMLTYDPTGPVTFNGIEYVPREEALAEPHDGDLTAAYVLGSQKANERLKVLQGYVKRLEEKISDFYECDATRRGCCRQVARDQAHAALDRIREGR